MYFVIRSKSFLALMPRSEIVELSKIEFITSSSKSASSLPPYSCLVTSQSPETLTPQSSFVPCIQLIAKPRKLLPSHDISHLSCSSLINSPLYPLFLNIMVNQFQSHPFPVPILQWLPVVCEIKWTHNPAKSSIIRLQSTSSALMFLSFGSRECLSCKGP